MLSIIKDITRINRTLGRGGKKIKAIIIHDTGNVNDSAKGNANYFRNTTRRASAHYFVDDNYIVQVVEDCDTAWHIGLYNKGLFSNGDTIGIEMCRSNNQVTEKTYNKTLDLVRQLMKEYSIPKSNVLRHVDVCNKNCPSSFTEGRWNEFKALLDVKTEVVKMYQNGSTTESVYCDSECLVKIGSLDPYEKCEYIKTVNNKALITYYIGGTKTKKVGFVKWLGGIK